jgi:GNAT superfamily N-acetyltransferase
MTPTLRPARTDEAETLTELMRRSKAHWGYDAEFMRLAQDSLKITSAQIERAIAVYVVEEDGRALGFYQLKDVDGLCWLEDLFIEPDAMGKGCGKLLFEHAMQMAREQGYGAIEWESDPNAEAFYLKMGAESIGAKPVGVHGRLLPIMRIRL